MSEANFEINKQKQDQSFNESFNESFIEIREEKQNDLIKINENDSDLIETDKKKSRVSALEDKIED